MFRIQVFHCLHHDGEGGKTLLVDGFNAAEKLRGSNPSYFDTLVTMTVPHEYIEGSHYHLYSLGTVLSTDLMTGALTQIRWVGRSGGFLLFDVCRTVKSFQF